MYKFYLHTAVYFLSFLISLYGLRAVDFNRFLKQNKVGSAWVLYFVLAFSLAYLLGSFLIAIIYALQ